jgi:hypothetical protein
MSSKNFYGLTGDVTVDGGILNVGNAQLYANTETSNVGIGTPNPEFELDVRGDANVHNLYATYLHGDGSNIENIVSSQWEGSPGDPIYYASNVGIANTSPVTTTMQIGSNVVIDDVGSNVMHVTGNVHATRFIGDGAFLENIASNLHEITTNGNVTTNTVQFDGSTSLVTTGSVGIANTAPVHNLDIGSNLYVEDAGSNVLYVTGNIYADYLVGDGSQLTGIAASLDQIVDQGNTVSNTIQIVSGQDATSNIGLVTHDDVGISVSNTNPTGAFQFGVGSNLLVNVYSSNVLTVDGNVLAQKMTLGTVTVTPAYNLQQITTKGATTSQTLILENATTGLTTTSNVGIANTAPVHTLDVGSNLYVEDTGSNVLTVTGNVSVSGDLNVGSNLSVEDTGSNVLSVTGNVSVSNRLDVGSNLHIENLRVAEVASNLVTYDSTTGEIMDSGGLFSNKLAVVSEQPPIALTGASTLVTNHGTYTIEASSGTVVNLFDKVIGESNKWETDGNYSTAEGTEGTYEGSASLAGHTGEWVKITMPYKTILRHIKIESTNESVEDIELVGLNADGLTWSNLKTETGLTGTTHTIIVNATTHHRTYGLIVEKTNTTTGRSAVEIGDLKLFTESFSIDGGKVEMASSAVMGGETTMDQHGPHSRDPTTPLLKKFPEIVFDASKYDQNHSTNTYVQAGYTVTASSQATDAKIAAKLYNDQFPININTDDGWQSQINTYNGSTGVATSLNTLTGITGATSSRNGSYTTLELPHKIKLSYLQIHTRNSVDHNVPAHPKEVYVYGSNDGSSWTQVGSHLFTSVPSSPIWQRIDINSTTPYKYFVLQTTSILPYTDENGNPTSLNRVYILDLEWYGYEEDPPAGDTSVDTTFTSIMNTPQTGGVKVYVDGNTLDNKVSGPDATGPSATYDSTGKYWELTGSLESNIAVEANTFLSGDAPHSVSMWFNSSNLEANVSNTCVFSISDQEKLDSVNLDLQSNTWHNLTYAYQGEGGSRVTYLDGRKVAEDQAEDTFGDYPPFAMTGYSQGGYVASASSEFIETGALRYAYGAYDPSVDFTGAAGHVWMTEFDTFNPNAVGGDTFIDSDGGTHTGHWNKLELPYKLKPSYLYYKNTGTYTTARCASDWVILGSNDDTTWDLVHTSTTVLDTTLNIPINSTKAYKYLMFLCKTINSSTALYVQQLAYYGHRENDLVRLPDPTNVLEYPHIAVGVPQDTPAKRGYVVTTGTSIFSGRTGARAFDDQPTGDGWETDNGSFSDQVNQTGGDTFTNLGSGGGSFTGHWIQLEMPHKLKFTGHIEINAYVGGTTDDRRPDAGAFLGSNDGSNWYLLHEFTSGSLNWVSLGGTTNQAKITTLSASNTNAYKYVVMVITKKSDVGTSTVTKTSIRRLRYYGTGVDSIPIQIGGGNIDKVANFRVYDKFVGEDQALEIWDAQKDEFGRAKSSMTLHKGRLGIGTTEPEGRLAVADEPNGLEEFPPRPMTGYKTYFEGHGEFCVSASSYYGTYYPWGAFDRNITDTSSDQAVWHTTADFTNATPGIYNAGASLGGYTGAWLKLKLPYSIKPSKVSIHPRTYPSGTSNFDQNPKDFLILGSKDDNTWDVLSTQVGVVFGTTWKDFILSPGNNTYNYFAISCTKVKHGSYFAINDMKYFGIREQGQSVLHDGQLTLTKNLNVPRIGPALDADDTPRRDRLVVEYNTSTNPTFEGAVRDTSGRGNDGVFYGGASYDATEKALVFDGTSGCNISGNHNLSGSNPVHTISGWIKKTSTNTGWEYLFTIGTSSTGNMSGFTMNSGNLYFTIFGDGVVFNPPDNFNNNWQHIVGVYTGGTTLTPSNFIVYVNGVKVQTIAGLGNTFTLTGNQVTLGANTHGGERFTGQISNFKLYDTALTAEEVKTLYDMGRTGHIVNPQPLHIAAPVQVEKTLRIPVDSTNTGTYTAGMIRYNPDLDKIQVYNGTVWLTIGGVSATGGTITQSGGYTIHTFTSSGTFTVTSGGDMEYLIVAGGGAGGYNHGGGGGGGGVLTGTLYGLENGSYTITRGAGGAFVSAGTGGNGSNSTALGLTAIGGGGGGKGYGPNGSVQAQAGANGSSGGSGGGGGPFHVGGAGTAGPPIQGYVGGNGINNGSQAGHGGGGGGAGGVGGNGLISGENNQGVSGKGGIGLVSLISGSSSQYAGGGSGGRWGGSLTTDVAGGVGSASGGGGIGGAKSSPEAYYATAGTSNTGGGGGGGGDGGANGANGGSGIVIIRYLS